MFFPSIYRLPGWRWAVYHGYLNLDEEDPKQNTNYDVEANSELQGLLSPEQKIPKPKLK